LKPLHLGTDRRLRELERLRSLGEATKVYDRNDRAEKFNRNIVDRGPSLHGLAFLPSTPVRVLGCDEIALYFIIFHYVAVLTSPPRVISGWTHANVTLGLQDHMT